MTTSEYTPISIPVIYETTPTYTVNDIPSDYNGYGGGSSGGGGASGSWDSSSSSDSGSSYDSGSSSGSE